MEEGVLSFDNILGEEDIETLFESPEDSTPEKQEVQEEVEEPLIENL